jgi:hypothetical protein
MSWLDRIKTDYVITCGDGKSFTPLWLTASKEVEYNVAQFEFPNISGTLVKRSLPKGRVYSVQIYFQGDNHLDLADAFEASADDPRAWVIQHPFYGTLTVQPTGLKRDNTEYNVSQIRTTVIETITEDNPKVVTDVLGTINTLKTQLDETLLLSFTVTPSQTDLNTMKATNKSAYTSGSKLVLASETEGYFNSFNTANAAIQNGTAQPVQAMRTLQAVINAPSLFAVGVKSRTDLIVSQFGTLLQSIATISKPPSKKIFELNAAALVSSLCSAVVSPLKGDYNTRKDVLYVIDALINPITGIYTLLLTNLDSLQTPNGGLTNSYIPDAQSMIGLNQLINYTIANLFDIALGAKQERSYVCEEDTNPLLLTHRFYGLDQDDENLSQFIKNNNIGLSELFQIRKGRTVIYYV